MCFAYSIFASAKAKVAQLVEHELPKLGVAGSSPVFRSREGAVPRDYSNNHQVHKAAPRAYCGTLKAIYYFIQYSK